MKRLYSPEDVIIGQIQDRLADLVKIKIGGAFAGVVQPLTREQLSVLIETAFWAGLRSDEGRTTRVSVAAVSPENFHDAVKFETPVAYDEPHITKLAPAVPRAGCLLASGSGDALNIWGFGRSLPGPWLAAVTIELSEPGIVRVRVGPYRSFAVLNGQSDSIIASVGNDLAHYLQRVLGKTFPSDDFIETQAVWHECLALADLARMVLADGHGGAFLVVSSETGDWEKSVSFAYRFATPDTTIRDAIRQKLKDENAKGEMLQQLSQLDTSDELKNLAWTTASPTTWGGWREVSRTTASLAGVDGAVVVTRELKVLGFGAMIATLNDPPQVCMFNPVHGSQKVVPSPLNHVKGARHQSAAHFTAVNKGTVALVISQDRHISAMHWDETNLSVVVVRNVEWWL